MKNPANDPVKHNKQTKKGSKSNKTKSNSKEKKQGKKSTLVLDESPKSPKEQRDTLREKLVYVRELFLGRTKKQKRYDKPSFTGKPMFGIYLFFIFYTFILVYHMNTQNETGLIKIIAGYITFNDPYSFGLALSITFIMLSLLLTNEKILVWFFKGQKIVFKMKRLGIIMAIITGNFFMVRNLVPDSSSWYTMLSILAAIWLLFQSTRLYSGSRGFATKIESKLTQRYSVMSYIFALITPYIVLGFLTAVAWIFRYLIVIFTLDTVAPGHPDLSLNLYSLEMETIMPLIYISLLMIFVFMITNANLTRKRGDSRRAGAFDNLTFSFITFIMFFYALYNIILYFFLDPKFLTLINLQFGGGEGTGESGIFFVVEFVFTMLFLLWIISDISKQFQSGFMFLNKDGLVMLLLGAIVAQTTSRLRLHSTELSGEISPFARALTLDHVILPFLILLFMGVTIVLYYVKPQEASMFMRRDKAVVAKEDKEIEIILKFLKREYVRRGDKYEIDATIINQIMAISMLSSETIWELIERIGRRYIDIQLDHEKTPQGGRKTSIDLLPITERYQKGKDAQKRADSFMRNMFTESIQTSPKKRRIKLSSEFTEQPSTSDQSDLFIQALGVQYGRKIQDDAAKKRSQKDDQMIIDLSIDHDTRDLIFLMIRKEYISRICDAADYPDDFRFKISEISDSVEKATRVTPGRLYPLLAQMAAEDWNFSLNANFSDKSTADDKIIEFLPIDDFEIYYALEEFRPEHTREIVVLMQTWFDRNIHHKRRSLDDLPPIEYADEDAEFQRSFRSRWFAETMKHFAKTYNKRIKDYDLSKKSAKLKAIKSHFNAAKAKKKK